MVLICVNYVGEYKFLVGEKIQTLLYCFFLYLGSYFWRRSLIISDSALFILIK